MDYARPLLIKFTVLVLNFLITEQAPTLSRERHGLMLQ